jgi:hypothetical protein
MVALPPIFDLVILLRNGSGDTYPWNQEQVERAISLCSKYVVKEILNSKHYFVATGKFPSSCLKVYP